MFSPIATQSAPDTGERLVNWFYRPSQSDGGRLLGRSGSEQVAYLGGPVRAMAEHNGGLYAVAGSRLWNVLDLTQSGEVFDDPTAQMVSNGSTMVIVSNGQIFASGGSGLSRALPTGGMDVVRGAAYLGGFVVLIGEGQGRKDLFQVSDLDNARSYDALDWATAEYQNDPLVAVIADHGQLWLFGTRTIETWYLSGDADFPFARNSTMIIEQGCYDARTVTKEDNGVYWVGHDRVVYRSFGEAPQAVSTRPLDEIVGATDIESACVLKDRGHKFYLLRTSTTTWALDITTGLWVEFSTDGGPYFGTVTAWVGSQQYIGTSDGRVVTLGDGYTDAGAPIECEAVSAPIERGGAWFRPGRVRATFASGQEDIGRDAEALLQTSEDGVDWCDPKPARLGRKGKHFSLAQWHGLGAFQQLHLRVRITDPVSRDFRGVSVG